MSLARTLLLAAIAGYKRHVSPYKGFACAWRVHAGGCSCSTLGLRAISRYGAWRGLGVLRLRLDQCRLVAQAQPARAFVPRHTQAGFIDCVACDAGCFDGAGCIDCGNACDAIGGGLDALSCLDCGDSDCCGDLSWRRSPRSPLRPRGRRAILQPRQPEPDEFDGRHPRASAPPPT